MKKNKSKSLAFFSSLVVLLAIIFTVQIGIQKGYARQQQVPSSSSETSAFLFDTGTCCSETGSICKIGDLTSFDHYYKKEGSCKGPGE